MNLLKKTIFTGGEDVKEQECAHAACESVKWCCHFQNVFHQVRYTEPPGSVYPRQ